MKVLFIYPNAGSQLGFNYGVAHLSSVLKSAGHEVALLQLCEEISPLPSRQAFISAVQNESPDLIGFSVVTNQWAYTRKLAAWAREACSAPTDRSIATCRRPPLRRAWEKMRPRFATSTFTEDR